MQKCKTCHFYNEDWDYCHWYNVENPIENIKEEECDSHEEWKEEEAQDLQ